MSNRPARWHDSPDHDSTGRLIPNVDEAQIAHCQQHHKRASHPDTCPICNHEATR